MKDSIIRSFDIWTTAQSIKSKGRLKSIENISLEGIVSLRELILELAVRGKLVPQDPYDEPASILLNNINKIKEKLTKEDRLKTFAKNGISSEEEYIGKPLGWEYCKLGNISKFIDYRGKTPEKTESGIRLITAKNVRFGYISFEPEEFISEDDYEKWMTRGFPRENDILFTTEAPLGNAAVIDIKEKFALAQRVICFQLHDPRISSFLRIAILSNSFQCLIIEKATGMTASGIKSAKLKEIPVPLPPLAEQYRIIAKVDELMAICDKLEEQQTSNLKTHQLLVKTLLETLTQAVDVTELEVTIERISIHFGTLFCTEDSIDQLKQPILQLAVMGKLVKQDARDEPASELLKRIDKEKDSSVTPKKRDREKQNYSENISFFEIPGWAWCKLEDIGYTNIGLTYSPNDLSNNGTIVLRSSNIQNGEIELTDIVRVEKNMNENVLTKQGDLLICARNGSKKLVGKCALIRNLPEPMAFGAFMAIFRSAFNEYIRIFIESPIYRKNLEGVTTTTINQITQDNLKNTYIPFPPRAEQQRIVAKVEELFNICDALKAKIMKAGEIKVQMAEAVVESATA